VLSVYLTGYEKSVCTSHKINLILRPLITSLEMWIRSLWLIALFAASEVNHGGATAKTIDPSTNAGKNNSSFTQNHSYI
jgi:hypothetical protein